MGTLYIDRRDIVVKLDGMALSFYNNGLREGIVPIRPLKRVIVIGNISLETGVLHKLSGEGISVLFLSGKRQMFCGRLQGRIHNNGLLRVKQYGKSLSPFAMEAALDLVRRKISARRNFMQEVIKKRPALRYPLTRAIAVMETCLKKIDGYSGNMDSLRGVEGSADAAYFKAFTKMFPPSLKFTGRNKRPPRDPVNAMLSLCYTMLHFEIVREIEVIGLDPVIGFYHQFEYGRESLACDLIEPYRPLVDRFVWDIFRDRIFTQRDFVANDERPGTYLKKGSRKRYYPLYEEWAKEIRIMLTEETRSLARRILDGQDPLPE
ncbi:MAG: CRISPR-associated endonuclease Cas1 [Nitrospirota bacterium]